MNLKLLKKWRKLILHQKNKEVLNEIEILIEKRKRRLQENKHKSNQLQFKVMKKC